MSKRNARRNRNRGRQLVEQRAASYGPVPLNDSHTLFGNYPMTSTGIRVDNYSASCNIVFRRCCEIIAEAMGKMSPHWQLLGPDKVAVADGFELELVTEASNHYTTAYNGWSLVFDWAESWGNGYFWILRTRDLTPIGLFPLHPSRVIPRVVRNVDPNSLYPWDLIYQIDGGRETFLPYEIIHIKGNPGFDGVTGYNVVQLHENTLAIAQAQNEYTGEFYANGAVAGGLVELPAGMAAPTVEKYRRDFQNQYSSRGNRHKVAIVDAGVKFTETTISPENSQLLESRKFSIYEIALMKGVPPTMLGDLSHGTFNNTEQQQISFNTLKLHPQCENARQELNMKLTPDRRHKWRYNLKAIDAADTATRQNYIHTATGGPWMSVEEARQEDGLPAEVAGTIYPPSNMTAESGSDGRPAPKTADAEPEPKDDDTTPPDQRALPAPAIETRSLADHQKTVESLAPVFVDVATRAAGKEAKAIRGLTKHLREGHPENFNAKTADFYAKHEGQLTEAFTPALTVLNATVRRHVQEERSDGDMAMSDDAAVGVYAKAMAGRHAEHAQATIAAMLTANPAAASAADSVDSLMGKLEKQAAFQASHELRQAAGYLTREAYRAAGCKSLRWVANPSDPEECRAMNGKLIGIDEEFAPGRHHPPLGEGCRCGIKGE